MRGSRMPYARRFNSDGLEVSTSLELLSPDKTSIQHDYKPVDSVFAYLSYLRATSCYCVLHDDRLLKIGIANFQKFYIKYLYFRLIAVLMVSLYTSGLLAVLYMLIMISKFDKELENCTTTKIAITDAKVTIVDIKL
ncbi:hypothetical protein X798_04951 [Onchocerca flexuosa]|uniref:Ion_trans domain-containing protein n=2 Tax=Onchocerca flexuosa TaxID=387005 RepID=A0A183HF50_9BILA|nr:hypothetical protein X798_04951 [Onchocerca flexuosa]VDO45452.1 unnamed protein product [Onchocerca flexuosa]